MPGPPELRFRQHHCALVGRITPRYEPAEAEALRYGQARDSAARKYHDYRE